MSRAMILLCYKSGSEKYEKLVSSDLGRTGGENYAFPPVGQAENPLISDFSLFPRSV